MIHLASSGAPYLLSMINRWFSRTSKRTIKEWMGRALLSSGTAGPAAAAAVGWIISAFRKGCVCYVCCVCYVNAPARAFTDFWPLPSAGYECGVWNWQLVVLPQSQFFNQGKKYKIMKVMLLKELCTWSKLRESLSSQLSWDVVFISYTDIKLWCPFSAWCIDICWLRIGMF